MRTLAKVLILGVLFLAVLGYFAGKGRERPQASKSPVSKPVPVAAPKEKEPTPIRTAIYLGRHAVQIYLEPKRAKFPLAEDSSYGVSDLGEGKWRVSGIVDTVNDFNAPARRLWIVEYQKEAAGKIRVTSIQVE